MIEIEPNFQRQNKFNNDDLVCFCFEFTKKDIEKDFNKNDRSLIYEKNSLRKKGRWVQLCFKESKGQMMFG